jgi:dihydrofolate reductase
MRKIRYGVAMSLDGYISGPNGETDWIVPDPEVNFAEIWAQFDTALMGRRTYAAAVARLGEAAFRGMKTIVVSRTLRPEGYPEATIFSELRRDWIAELRAQNGKDIWLFGGGALFGSLLQMHEVDMVEVSVLPVLLGGGVALLPPCAQPIKLSLARYKVYGSGRVSLAYDVQK